MIVQRCINRSFFNAAILLITKPVCRPTLSLSLSFSRCKYHEDLEVIYCSLRECNIYCFVISEALCPKFGVSLTVKHLPKGLPPIGGQLTPRNPSLQPWMCGAPPTSSLAMRTVHSEPDIGRLSIGRGRGRGLGRVCQQPSSAARVGGFQGYH